LFDEELRTNAKGQDASLKAAFNDFFIRNIIVRKDGGYLIVMNQNTIPQGMPLNRWGLYGIWQSLDVPMDYTITLPMAPFGSPWNRWNSLQNTRYNAENIMVLSYNKDGTIDWSGIIPKTQYDDESII